MADVKTVKELYTNVLKEKGVRYQYQFQVTATGDDVPTDDYVNQLQFFGSTYSLPALENTVQDIPYQGMTFRVPNAINFGAGNWTTEVRSDYDDGIRDTMLMWQKKFADPSLGGGGEKRIPSSTFRVDLLTEDLQSVHKTFVLEGVWPSTIGESTLNIGGTDLLTFSVTFTYQYWYYGKAGSTPVDYVMR